MNTLMNVVTYKKCTEKKLVKDVKEISGRNGVFVDDCWKFIINNPSTPSWMRIMAREQVEGGNTQKADFQKLVDNAFTAYLGAVNEQEEV